MAENMSQFVAQVRNLTAGYRHHMVLTDLSFEVPEGIILGIVGPNGAGKSTLLKALLGLLGTMSGSIRFFGEPLAKVRPDVAYMPQSLTLDPTFPVTVHDVVLMGTAPTLGWLRRPGKQERQHARAALESVHLSHLEHRPIGELSGGQRQRVLLARALAQQPALLIMDEPFQGVDAASERNIVAVLRTLRASGVTIMMVHHDLMTVLDYCDWVALVNHGIPRIGPAEDVFTASNLESVFGIPNLAGA